MTSNLVVAGSSPAGGARCEVPLWPMGYMWHTSPDDALCAVAGESAEVPMSGSDLVLFSVDDHVALITVNDPERRNAVTGEMSKQLRAAVERAEADSGVHAVVVTGAGKAFCAGADLSALGSAAEEGLLRLYDGFMAVGKCALPTIAAVNGPAVGAGLNLALAADVRIAARSARFAPGFVRLGLHPGGGNTWLLERAVGQQMMVAMTLFGEVLDGAAAAQCGLAL